MRVIPVGLFKRLWRSLAPLSGWRPFHRDGDSAEPGPGVRVPRRSSPGGRSSAVAVAEPDHPRDNVNAVGRVHHRAISN
jgi:hypothetical protein